MKLTALLLLFAALGAAQEMPRMTTWEKAWRASVVAIGVAKGLDIASTHHSIGNGARETNPFFSEAPSTKSYLISSGVIVAFVLVQYKIKKDHPGSVAAKAFSITNFSIAGGAALAAVNNWGVAAEMNHRRTR